MALINCEECNHKISSLASSCPNCGAPVDQDSIYESPAKNFTLATSYKSSFVENLGVFFCCLVLAFVCLLIPFIGIFLSGALLIGSISGFMGGEQLYGDCPYCGIRQDVASTAVGHNCRACRKRILVKDSKFYKT